VPPLRRGPHRTEGGLVSTIYYRTIWLSDTHLGTRDCKAQALLVLNRWFNRARRGFGFGYWSLSAYVKGRIKSAVNFVTDFEAALAREATRRGASSSLSPSRAMRRPLARSMTFRSASA